MALNTVSMHTLNLAECCMSEDESAGPADFLASSRWKVASAPLLLVLADGALNDAL